MDLRELEKAQEDYKKAVGEMQMLKGEELQLQKEKSDILENIKELGFTNVDDFLKNYNDRKNELESLITKVSGDLQQ